MNYKILSAVLVLALVSMACGFSFNIPETKAPGPDVTDQISLPAPDSGKAQLHIKFGAGKLTLSPGAGDQLVEGTATYNLTDLKPVTKQDGDQVELSQGDYQFNDVVTANKIKNEWDLKLGDLPLDLTIEAGAYEGQLDLGGLSLTSLTVKDGAAHTDVTFASPNSTEMSMLQYETGASNVTLTGLGNANFSTMIFRAGAGDYELDFSGELQQDATVNLNCGLSDVTLRIPKGVHAVVSVGGGLHNVSTSSGWGQSGSTYTQEGDGPMLTFVVEMGAGNLTLTD